MEGNHGSVRGWGVVREMDLGKERGVGRACVQAVQQSERGRGAPPAAPTLLMPMDAVTSQPSVSTTVQRLTKPTKRI